MKKLLFFTYTLDGSGSSQVLYNIVRNNIKDFLINIVALHDGEMVEKFKALNVPTNSFITKRNDFSIIKRIMFVFFSFYSIVKTKPDLIIFNTSRNFVPSLFSLFFPYKTLLIAHENFEQYNSKLKRVLIILSAFFSKRIVTVSNYLKKSYTRIFLLQKKNIQVIYNGLDFREAISLSLEHLPTTLLEKINGKIVLGQIGIINPNKNTSFLIELLRKLNEQENKYVLLIVGRFNDKIYQEEITNKIIKYNLVDNVFITDYVKNIYPYLKKIKILFVVSKMETFGLVVLEAMILNIPVIAKRIEALEELLGVNYKHFINELSIKEFLNKTLEILEDNSKDLENYYLERVAHFNMENFRLSYQLLFKELTNS